MLIYGQSGYIFKELEKIDRIILRPGALSAAGEAETGGPAEGADQRRTPLNTLGNLTLPPEGASRSLLRSRRNTKEKGRGPIDGAGQEKEKIFFLEETRTR